MALVHFFLTAIVAFLLGGLVVVKGIAWVLRRMAAAGRCAVCKRDRPDDEPAVPISGGFNDDAFNQGLFHWLKKNDGSCGCCAVGQACGCRCHQADSAARG